MASNSNHNTRGLFGFLASHHKLHLLQSWTGECVKAEELKLDHRSFKQMRREKVLPKRLGKSYSKGADLEPFTDREEKAITQLIKDTSKSKEAAFARADGCRRTLYRETEMLVTEHPSLMDEIKAHCDVIVSKARKEKQKKINHNLKIAISNSRWKRIARPDAVVEMSGGRLAKR